MKISALYLCRIEGVWMFDHFRTESISNINVTWQCSWCLWFLFLVSVTFLLHHPSRIPWTCVVHGPEWAGVMAARAGCQTPISIASPYYREIQSLTKSGACHFDRGGWPESFGDVHASPIPLCWDCWHLWLCPTFMCLLEIWTHVLMIANQVLLLTEPLPRPQLSFIISVSTGKQIWSVPVIPLSLFICNFEVTL